MNAANDKTKGVVIYRATGNVIYWDYGSEGTVHEEGQHLAESLSTRSGYPLTVLPKYDSTDAGGCADYFIEEGIPAVSLVVGEGTSPVDISAFPDIWTANLNILPMLANLYTNG
jgi:g-D-glutamyl-meso-diaminopimelate peptidase